MIDITGLNRVDVLMALANGTSPRGLGMLAPPPSRKDAEGLLNAATNADGSAYVDYFAGRPLKVEFVGDTIRDERLYDRDAYEGACAAAVDSLRKRVLAA